MNNNKSYIFAFVGIAVVIGLLYWFGRSTPEDRKPVKNNQLGALALTTEEKGFDFGEISMAAGKVSHKFKIKNSNSESYPINQIYTSCMCTSVSLLIDGKRVGPFGMPGHGFGVIKINEILEVGEEAELEVTFDPAAHGPAGVGTIARSVFVESETGSPLELNIKATVKP